MAFSTKKQTEPTVVSEINVTPFIDVMLVLLIIFMVAAPLSTVNVPLDLPTSNSQVQQNNAEPIVLSLNENLDIHVGEDKVSKTSLGQKLQQVTKGNADQRIYIRADKAVSYDEFMNLVNTLASLGYAKVALVGESSGESK